MRKRIVVVGILAALIPVVLFSGEAGAFEELQEELDNQNQPAATRSKPKIYGVGELQMIDIGLPWTGVRLDYPIDMQLPGRQINPDYITFEGLYKVGGYNDAFAFQGRTGLKYDLQGSLYAQLGIGYINAGGAGGLTALAKTGLAFSPGSFEVDAGVQTQRTLLGGFLDEYDAPRWLGVSLAVGL